MGNLCHIYHGEYVQNVILRYVNITEEELFWLKVDTGLEYIDHYCPLSTDEADKQTLKESRAFWEWWDQIWSIKDKQILERYNENAKKGFLSVAMPKEKYAEHHSAQKMSWYPNTVVRKTLRDKMFA